jgi:hypothetical protein
MENKFYVYIYLDPRKKGKFTYGKYNFENEPFYIGKGHGRRVKKHIYNANSRNTNNFKENKIRKIRKEINQDPIIIILQDKLFEQQAFDLEIKLIKTIGRNNIGTGPLCNFTDGGEGSSGYIPTKETREKNGKAHLGSKRSEITKERMRLAQLGEKNHNYGKKANDEVREKLSESQLLRYQQHPFSEESKELCRINNLGKNKGKRPRLGKHHTQEAKEKSRAKQKGRPISQEQLEKRIGKPLSEITKERIRQTLLNKKRKASEETLEKQRKANLGENNPNYGKHWKIINGERILV